MANKTPDQLPSASAAGDADLLMIWPSGGPLKSLSFLNFITQVISALSATYLRVTNNLSDLASASSARANLGLGTAATLASSALFQVANNLSEIGNAASARGNLGAAASNAPDFTGGLTYAGSHKANVQAVGAASLDLAVAEFFTKSISGNTTFTFDNATASKGMAFTVQLTISSSAVPSWPASVQWSGGINPSTSLGNGKHLLGFITYDGGVTWVGALGPTAVATPT